jgi:hypothetical protein
MLPRVSRVLLKAVAKIAAPERADTFEMACSDANELPMSRRTERDATATIYAGVHG